MDWDCRYVNVNPAFQKHTGLNPDTVNGKTIREIYPGSEAGEIIEMYAGIISGGMNQTREIFFKPMNRWFEISVFPMQDNHFSVVIQSITDQKRSPPLDFHPN